MRILIIVPVLMSLWLVAGHAQQRGTTGSSTLELPIRIVGTAISAGGVGNPTGTARVEITLHRVSSDQQTAGLLQALKTGGQQALLDRLIHEESVGTVRFDTELAWDLRLAMLRRGNEGVIELALATDRPMSAWELFNSPRYADYPFTLINLRLDGDRPGTGTMILAAQITSDSSGRFVHVENFASTPIQLTRLEVSSAR